MAWWQLAEVNIFEIRLFASQNLYFSALKHRLHRDLRRGAYLADAADRFADQLLPATVDMHMFHPQTDALELLVATLNCTG